jgi:hypothetical protein
MERRVNKKVVDYVCGFKDNMVEEIQSIFSNPKMGLEEMQKLINGKIYNYPSINIGKEDFAKRKRVKNTVPIFERCCAKRANGEQCTRRKKDEDMFCGTHVKGTPHGHMDEVVNDNVQKSVEVFVVEIKGVAYYVDTVGNIYSPEDVMANKDSPRIISKYSCVDGEYSLI